MHCNLKVCSTKTQKCGAIELMRFIFCISIVALHCKKIGNPPPGTALFSEAGYIGVEFFFLVSGFLMAKTALSKSIILDNLGKETISFVWRKVKTILPYYFLAFAFSFLYNIISKGFGFRETLEYLLWGIWDFAFLRMTGITHKTVISATWYLSALYFSMLMLYPILLKFKETFTYIGAPILSLFLLGYLKKTYGHLDLFSNNFVYVYSGVIRAVAELSLGCVCFVVCEKIKKVKFTKFGRLLISLVQIAGYTGVLICACKLPSKDFVYVMLLTLAVCVPLTFSQQGILSSMCNNKMFYFLGKISMVVYLNHMWVQRTMVSIFPATYGYWRLLLIIFGSTLILSAAFIWLVGVVCNSTYVKKKKWQRLFLLNDNVTNKIV